VLQLHTATLQALFGVVVDHHLGRRRIFTFEGDLRGLPTHRLPELGAETFFLDTQRGILVVPPDIAITRHVLAAETAGDIIGR